MKFNKHTNQQTNQSKSKTSIVFDFDLCYAFIFYFLFMFYVLVLADAGFLLRSVCRHRLVSTTGRLQSFQIGKLLSTLTTCCIEAHTITHYPHCQNAHQFCSLFFSFFFYFIAFAIYSNMVE